MNNSEVLLIPTDPGPRADSPAARASTRAGTHADARVHARARVESPPPDVKTGPAGRRRKAPKPARQVVRRPGPRRYLIHWWAWTSRPPSLRAAWRGSAVTKDRIPLGSTPVGLVWHAANWTERLIFFAFTMAVPTFVAGPVRWLVQRPTRRWAFYLVVGAVAGLYLLGR